MKIQGQTITLHLATLQDRSRIFNWLAHSDLTSSMLGPPLFTDNPVPTWEEFTDDYQACFFEADLSLQGHCFIINVKGEAVGQINYNKIDLGSRATELDIWMSERKNTGHGYGTDALQTLCQFLHQAYGLTSFYIAPSARNIPAIKSYLKAGFIICDHPPVAFIPDYKDTVLLIKTIDDNKKIL